MLTEDEAKTKWCPFARVPGTLQRATGEIEKTGAQNRGYAMGGPLHNCMCIGSACMAFRWEMTLESGSNYPHHRPPHWHRWRYIDPNDPATEGETRTDRGFCGLAGKP